MDLTTALWYFVLASGVLVSIAVVIYLSDSGGRWRRTARSRLYAGVPWGTLFVVLGVAAFYLFVQDGLANPTQPLDVPFRAYSYFYPLGMLTSGIAHSGLGHVTSNLLAALVFGSLAEYAWGHFPPERTGESFPGGRPPRNSGSSQSARESLHAALSNPSFRAALGIPFVRIGLWVCGIFAVAVSTSLFGLGPVIGFSGTVFALVGFALVRYPIATVVAAFSARIVTGLYDAIRYPEVQQTAVETFSRPWWAGIAVQGHALGLLIGAILGIALLYRRNVRPKPEHVWLAVLAFAVDRGLWAIYLPEGGETYRLFRALGTAAVFLFAALLAGGATATPRRLRPDVDISRREVTFGLVVAVVVAVSAIAVPLNFYAVDDPSTGLEDAEPVEVRDYTVFYAEDVENQFVPAVPLPGDNRTNDRINASGLIVVSDRRNIWWEEVSRERLAANREATIRVGGLTWNEDIRATRTTWAVAGGNSTYHVRLGPADVDHRPVVFGADPAEVDVIIDGRNVTIAPVDEHFEIAVSRDGQRVGMTRIPEGNESVSAGGLTFAHEERSLFAERGETRVRIAQRPR